MAVFTFTDTNGTLNEWQWNSGATWTLTSGTAADHFPGINDTADIDNASSSTHSAISLNNTNNVGQTSPAASVIISNYDVTFVGLYQFGSLTIGNTVGTSPDQLSLASGNGETPSLEIGTTGGATSGAITIDTGRTLIADGYATLEAPVTNHGTILASADTLTISGALTTVGGMLQIGASADLIIDNTAADVARGPLHVTFSGTGATLELASAGASLNDSAVSVNGLGVGDRIQIDGTTTATSVTYTTQLSLNTVVGVLTAGNYSFLTSGAAGGLQFQSQVINGDTVITAQTQSDSYTWGGAGSGYWENVADWTVPGAPTDITAPGSTNAVTLANTGSSTDDLTGGGGASNVTVTGAFALHQGTYGATGNLTVGAANSTGNNHLTLDDSSFSVGNIADIIDGTITVTDAGTLTVANALSMASDGSANVALAATVGSKIQLDSLSISSTGSGTKTVSVDATSSIEVGTAGGAAAGSITIDAGNNLVLDGVGSTTLVGDLVNNGAIYLNKTSTVITGALSGSGLEDVSGTSTLTLDGTGAAGNSINLAPNAALDIGASAANQPYAVASTISGFSVGNGTHIQLNDTVLTNAAYTDGTDGLGTLALYDGTTLLESLTLDGSYTGDAFVVSESGGNASVIVQPAACYRRGTRILTDRGERAIEDLAIGDWIRLVSGDSMPIRWIGRRSYSESSAAGNRAVLPVLIRAGALGDQSPRRDLWVSPEHAMFIDGLLISALALVNGQSIVQDEAVGGVTYYHLEFDTHAVLFAEGAPGESFVDDQSRDLFDNAAEYQQLYPQAVRTPARFCAPRVEDGWELEAVRLRLARRCTDRTTSVSHTAVSMHGRSDSRPMASRV